MLNKLLQEQIHQHLGDTNNIPDGWKELLNAISTTYDSLQPGDEQPTHNAPQKKRTAARKSGITHIVDEVPATTADAKILALTELLKNETQKREQLEEDMQRRENHVKALQRIAHIGSWQLEFDANTLRTTKLTWSDETYRIFGYEPHSVAVDIDLFFKNIPVEEHEAIHEAWENAINNTQKYDIEHRVVWPNGTERVVRERSDIIIDPATGKPKKVIGTVQDITERVMSRRKLQEAHDELRTLFDTMQEVFFAVDMRDNSGQVLQISKSCERVYGYTPEEFKADPELWLKVVLEEDKPIIYANYPVMAAGKSFSQQYKIHHKNGSIRWLESSMTPTLDKEGRLKMLYGVTTDITDRKEAEQALKDSEHRFRSMIEHSSDSIILANENLERIFVSNSAERVTGYKPFELLYAKSFSLVHPEDVELSDKFLKIVLENPGEPKSLVYRSIKKDGTVIWCERISTNLLHDPKIKGIVSNVRDITAHKEYEDALKAYNEDLRKSNMELDRFVYSVSHDLRAPLASILGIVQLSELETEDERILQHFDLIKTSVKKLDTFIQDILDYSRNARQEVRYESINFRELLNEVTGNLKFMSQEYGEVGVQLKVASGISFMSDRSRLSVILNNLVSNAIRYADHQRSDPYVEVDIKLSEEEAVITVKDNGIGIPLEHQHKVFDMFYRASTQSVGSGLGLYIVKETIDKMGGSIELESEPGKGTTFTIHLPNNLNN
jgi:PAS domain S-box-containing protein